MKKYLNLTEIVNFSGLVITAGLIWWGGSLFKIADHPFLASISTRLTLIGLLFLVWLIKVAFRYFLEYKTNQQMLTILGETEGKLSNNPSLSKKTLKKSLLILTQEIKKRSLQFGRKKTLFSEMPCFLILGSPHSGKTSCLAAADVALSFIEPHLQKALQNLQILDNVRWWFTQEAIFLEMDIIQDKADLHSTPLLKALKQLRSRRPIDGIVIVEDITHFLTSEQQITQDYTRHLHQYLRSLYAFFELHLPIYILFSKADLIPGFTEYFLGIDEKDKEKVLGYNIKDSNPLSIQKTIEFQHELFATHLESNLVHLLSKLDTIEQKGRCINFPKKILSFKFTLLNYLNAIFNFEDQEKPYTLQGVYFSMVSIFHKNYETANLSSAFNSSTYTATSSSPQLLKGYFLKEFFKRLIFFGLSEVSYNQYSQRLRTYFRRSLYGIISLGFVLFSAIGLKNYFTINAHTHAILNSLRPYRVLNPNDFITDKNILSYSLPSLEPFTKALDIYKSDLEWYQPYTIYELYEIEEALRKTLFLAIDTVYIPYLFRRVESLLNQETTDPERLSLLLRAYLAFKEQNKEYSFKLIQTVLTYDIKETYRQDSNLINKLLYYLNLALNRPFPSLSLNFELIQQKQALLASFDPVERAYRRLISMAYHSLSFNSSFPEQLKASLKKAFYFEGENVFIIPAFYTLQGYQQIFQPHAVNILEQILKGDLVLDAKVDPNFIQKNREEFLKRLEERYSQDYLTYWQNFLNQLKLIPTSTREEIISLLNTLGGKENLLFKLTNFIHQQILPILPLTSQSSFNTVEEFSALAEEQRQEQLASVTTSLNQLFKTFSSFSSPKSYFIFMNTLIDEENSSPHPLQMLKVSAQSQPKIVQEWLLEIIERISNLTVEQASSYIDKVWKEQIYPFYAQKIHSTYPFNKNAKTPLDLKDFKAFFSPGGILETFLTTSLSPLLSLQEKNYYSNNPSQDQNSKTEIKSFLHLAKTINSALDFYKRHFNEHDQLSFIFKIQPFVLDASLASLNFNFANISFSYRHGPLQQKTCEWKNPESEANLCEILITDFDQKEKHLKFEGPWAFFKLIDQSQIEDYKTGKSYLLTLPFPHLQVQLLLHLPKIIEFLKKLRSIQFPSSLFSRQ